MTSYPHIINTTSSPTESLPTIPSYEDKLRRLDEPRALTVLVAMVTIGCLVTGALTGLA